MTHQGIMIFHTVCKYKIEGLEEHEINILPSSITHYRYKQWHQENYLLIL